MLSVAIGLNAAAAIPWWIGLLVSPAFRRWFLPAATPDSALLAFALADAFLFIGAGLAAAYAMRFDQPWMRTALLLHTGGACYAALYTLLQSLLTGEAWLGAAAMAPSRLASLRLLEACAMKFIRVAQPASRWWNLCKTAVQTAGMWGGALWAGPSMVVALEKHLGIPPFEPLAPAGWSLFVAASALGLWSGFTMAWWGAGTPLPLDTARHLIIEGPYRWVRNPMAVAGLAQGIGVALILGSWLVIPYVFAGGLLWQLVARPLEEADLEARFGDEYRRYRNEVPCWRVRYTEKKGVFPCNDGNF